MSATVKDVMTTRVVAIRKNAQFKYIATLLTRYRISALPVLDDDGTVIGVVSETDLLCKEALTAAIGARASRPGPYHDDFARAAAVVAADLMTTPPVTITPGEPVTSAARLMYNARVKRLPVIRENGHLAGIVSRADVLSVYGRPDEEIGQEIMKNVILNEFPGNPGRFTVTVKDGIVTLEGHPETVGQGRDILADIWRVEGVVSVRDRLVYPEGMESREPPGRARSSWRVPLTAGSLHSKGCDQHASPGGL